MFFNSREEVIEAQGTGRALEEKKLLVWLAIILSYPFSSKGRGITADLSFMAASTVAGRIPWVVMFPGIVNILGCVGILAFFDCYYRLHHYGEGLHFPAVGFLKKITSKLVDRCVHKREPFRVSQSLLGATIDYNIDNPFDMRVDLPSGKVVEQGNHVFFEEQDNHVFFNGIGRTIKLD